jgi:protein-arginine kinase
MNIHAEKIEIMKMILDTDNPIILESVKNIFKNSMTIDFWDTLSQEQKDDILQGIKDIENGEIVDYEDFIKQYR